MPNSIGCLGTYRIVCCECQKVMEIKMTNDQRMMGKASHSFCSECVKAMKSRKQEDKPDYENNTEPTLPYSFP